MSFYSERGRGKRNTSFGSNSSTARGRGRGGYAPRGRGGRWRNSQRPPTAPDTTLHPLGSLITTLSNSDLDIAVQDRNDSTEITNCKYVASYNWLESTEPTILVPGKPPKWTPSQHPSRLKEDTGPYYRDPNAARYPSYPTQPAIEALLTTNPQYPTDKVQIFACGSTLGNLLRFTRSIDKPFRFSVELIGKTVFFIRKENSPTETIPNVKGYGHTFPEAYTTWESEVKGSETHQRLIEYDFAGLHCVVRFECDGYIDHSAGEKSSNRFETQTSSDTVEKSNNKLKSHTSSNTVKKTLNKPKTHSPPNESTLLQALKTTTLTPSPSPSITTTSPSNLKIHPSGTFISQTQIFELKTRSLRSPYGIDMQDLYPTLFLKQIPNLVTAYHDGYGMFSSSDIKVQNVSSEVREWAGENKEGLKRLGELLGRIVEIVKEEEGRVEVYCPSVDRLEIRRQYLGGQAAVHEDVRARWESASGVVDEGDITADQDAVDSDSDSDSEWEERPYEQDEDHNDDFTACGDECGYCGRCSY